jgi:uncharacterized membrane protein YccF (DUF307 family)
MRQNHPRRVARVTRDQASVDVSQGHEIASISCVRRGAPVKGWGERVMRAILNVIWLLLCGLWMAIGYIAAGLLCFVLIITIPFGIAAFRIAAYVLWPFGRTTEIRRDSGVGSLVGNVLWVILFGWWLALGHLVTGVLLCLTIIGIPLGAASFKIIPIMLMPLGVRIVPVDSYNTSRL